MLTTVCIFLCGTQCCSFSVARHLWQKSFPNETVNGSLEYSVTVCWGLMVFGLLLEFEFALFLLTGTGAKKALIYN